MLSECQACLNIKFSPISNFILKIQTWFSPLYHHQCTWIAAWNMNVNFKLCQIQTRTICGGQPQPNIVEILVTRLWQSGNVKLEGRISGCIEQQLILRQLNTDTWLSQYTATATVWCYFDTCLWLSLIGTCPGNYMDGIHGNHAGSQDININQ